MGTFLSSFIEMIFLSCLPPVLFGLAVWGCRQLYCWFVGDDSGRPLILAASALSTPVRELGHAMMAILSFHRIEDMCLLNLHDPDGELGFVEHSYTPRNPLAVLGNFLYALGPVVTGLGAILLIFLICFNGVLPPFFGEVAALGEQGAGFKEYALTALSLIPDMFGAGEANVWGRIIGCVLLLAVCLGVHITPAELTDALSGFLIFSLLLAFSVGVLMLFDDRVMRIALSGFRTYATAVTALFLVTLLFAAAMVALGFLFGVVRTLFNIDKGTPPDFEE
ncbi:MAG: hypothetical protein IJX39_02380 [Clostridia bacterium]|nr:hypothetical protein [Clostridia bacterium]